MQQAGRRSPTVVVTGVAGFIGSATAIELAAAGWSVVGIDGFTPYYDRSLKESNLADCRQALDVFRELVITPTTAGEAVRGADAVVHIAGQPGVRGSWDAFEAYDRHNVVATHALLDACLRQGIGRFVYASSSSVYGDNASTRADETVTTSPRSAYGVSKLAGEHLVGVAACEFDVSAVSLRYFTVYGPRQRPDMAIGRIVRAACDSIPFTLYGDGRQARDFTFVDDVARANRLALDATACRSGARVYNIAGGSSATVGTVIGRVGSLAGRPVVVDAVAAVGGDVARTEADCTRARDELGWTPLVGLDEGLARHVEWYERAMARR